MFHDLITSCLNVSRSSSKLQIDLRNLGKLYKNVEHDINLLNAQVSVLKAITTELRLWLQRTGDRAAFYDNLDTELRDILDGCVSVQDVIADHVFRVLKRSTKIGFRARIRYVWGSSELPGYRDWLRFQCGALSVITQTLQMPNRYSVQSFLNSEENQRIISWARNVRYSVISSSSSSSLRPKRKRKSVSGGSQSIPEEAMEAFEANRADISSSLLWLRDSRSDATESIPGTEGSVKELDEEAQFSFDLQLFSTAVYRSRARAVVEDVSNESTETATTIKSLPPQQDPTDLRTIRTSLERPFSIAKWPTVDITANGCAGQPTPPDLCHDSDSLSEDETRTIRTEESFVQWPIIESSRTDDRNKPPADTKGRLIRHLNSQLFVAIRNGDLSTVAMLLVRGADARKKDDRGFLPCHVAACHSNEHILQIVAMKSVDDIDVRGPRGNTAMHLACAVGQAKNCALLQAMGTYLEARNNEGETPLLSAVRGCGLLSTGPTSPSIVWNLLIGDVDMTVRNYNDQTALDILSIYLQDAVLPLPDLSMSTLFGTDVGPVCRFANVVEVLLEFFHRGAIYNFPGDPDAFDTPGRIPFWKKRFTELGNLPMWPQRDLLRDWIMTVYLTHILSQGQGVNERRTSYLKIYLISLAQTQYRIRHAPTPDPSERTNSRPLSRSNSNGKNPPIPLTPIPNGNDQQVDDGPPFLAEYINRPTIGRTIVPVESLRWLHLRRWNHSGSR